LEGVEDIPFFKLFFEWRQFFLGIAYEIPARLSLEERAIGVKEPVEIIVVS